MHSLMLLEELKNARAARPLTPAQAARCEYERLSGSRPPRSLSRWAGARFVRLGLSLNPEAGAFALPAAEAHR